MASNIRNIVEPVMGWLFVVVTIAALGWALLAATSPRSELARHIDVQRSR